MNMSLNYSSLCLVGIFVAGTVARVAIINGDIAPENQFPYQVSVQVQGKNLCGGGIIGDEFVLTAAHCIFKPDGNFRRDTVYVIAGTNNLNKTSKPAATIKVDKIFIPSKFDYDDFFGDIAILKLKRPLRLSKHIRKLDLPKDKNETYVGKIAKIAGWGWDWIKITGEQVHSGGSTDRELRYAQVQVLDHCHPNFDYHNTVSEREICAQVRQTDSLKARGLCYGDSGSVLVHDNTAIGVVSTSPWDCSELRNSTLYARVSYYLDFIKEAMNGGKHTDNIRVHNVRS